MPSSTTFPSPGHTVLAEGLYTQPGGKGANQALAAAVPGGLEQGKVSFATCVNSTSDPVLSNLRNAGVDLAAVRPSPSNLPTGVASVCVNEQTGENCIVVGSGANLEIDATTQCPISVESERSSSPSSVTVLVTQLEVPIAQTALAVSRAKERGAITLLNAAPANNTPLSMLIERELDYLIVNEHEACKTALSHNLIESSKVDTYSQASGEIAERAVKSIAFAFGCVTIASLGAQGAIAVDPKSRTRSTVNTPLLDSIAKGATVVDTTGAGDAFVGTFAACLAQQMDLHQSLCHAAASGTLACRAHGAQSSLPMFDEVQIAAREVQVHVVPAEE